MMGSGHEAGTEAKDAEGSRTRFFIDSRSISKDWKVRRRSVSVSSAALTSADCEVTMVVLSSICRTWQLCQALPCPICLSASHVCKARVRAEGPSPLAYLLGPVLVQLLAVLPSQLVILGPDVSHDLSKVLGFGGINFHCQPGTGNLGLQTFDLLNEMGDMLVWGCVLRAPARSSNCLVQEEVHRTSRRSINSGLTPWAK